MIEITGPGIFAGVPIDRYIADKLLAVPTLSAGCAHTIESASPRHGFIEHPRLNPYYSRDASKVADIGSIAHDVLLEGGTDCIEVIDPADHPNKPKKKDDPLTYPTGWTNVSIRAAQKAAREAGKYPILKAEFPAITAMVDAAREFIERTEWRGLFDFAEAEQTMIWTEGAVSMRARPDLLARDRSVLVHYKTSAGKVHPDTFERVIDSQHYDFTIAFYARGLADLEPKVGAHTRHIILAQEQESPFACALHDLAPAKFSIASSKVERAISIWARCMKSGKWPAYDTRVHSHEPKPWHIQAEEDKAMFYGLGQLDPKQADGIQA